MPNEIRGLLDRFFANNPEAGFEETGYDGIIKHPWGDETIDIRVLSIEHGLIAALNSLRLAPPFTALRHIDTGDMEFIWSPVTTDNPLLSRSFTFNFSGKDYKCEFGAASASLLSVARAARFPIPMGPTGYRNLYLFQGTFALTPPFQASSFWVRKVDLDETSLIQFTRHLNFYMTWFDRETPYILINEPIQRRGYIAPPSLPPSFPETINGRALDPYLLLLWESARTQEPFLRFLYYYHMLEYAAFYKLTEEASARIKRLLLTPDALARIDETTRGLIETVVDLNQTDNVKIANVIKLVIDPARLWPAIAARLQYFSAPVIFEGGLTLTPLIKEGWGLEDFKINALVTIPLVLSRLRNGLAHGRERRMTEVIYPTSANAQLLQPWIEPLRLIAAHAILYESS